MSRKGMGDPKNTETTGHLWPNAGAPNMPLERAGVGLNGSLEYAEAPSPACLTLVWAACLQWRLRGQAPLAVQPLKLLLHQPRDRK